MTAAHPESNAPRPPLTRDEARALTDSIKRSVERTWGQLEEAHARRAWVALDFPSWESYIVAEFGIRRSRSYQLLNQAKVIHEIADAAGVHSVDINEATARDIKPRLAEVVEDVREATADLPADQRPAVAADVVQEARERFVADRATGQVLSPQDWAARNPAPEPETSPAPSPDPAPAAEACRPAGAGQTVPDGWSPSDALDERRRHRPTGARPAATSTTRPSSIEDLFAQAVRDLQKAANEVERLTTHHGFPTKAKTLAGKHTGFITNAVEGLNIALLRLRKQAK